MTSALFGATATAVTTTTSFWLPVMRGLQCLHILTPKYISGTSAQNLAGIGAAASIIAGAPTASAHYLTLNQAGGVITDWVATQFLDVGGDMTMFGIVRNQDTLIGSTTQPMLLSNFGLDPGHTGFLASKGLQVQCVGTSGLPQASWTLKDFVNAAGVATTANSGSVSVANFGTGANWHLFFATVQAASGIRTIYDFTTSGVAAPVSSTNANPRLVNINNKFQFGANLNSPIVGGKCDLFLGGFGTALWTAAEIARVGAVLQARAALEGIAC